MAQQKRKTGLFTCEQIRHMRFLSGLNQQQFWNAVGVTQSGGSRYESNRAVPKSVQELIRLKYVEEIDLCTIKKEDFEVAKYLRKHEADLFKSLLKSAHNMEKIQRIEQDEKAKAHRKMYNTSHHSV